MMQVKRSHTGLWVALAALPIAALAVFRAALHYLGCRRLGYDLVHGEPGTMPLFVKLLLPSLALPFVAFALLRLRERLRQGKVSSRGTIVSAEILGVEPTGTKVTVGVEERWGAMLELRVMPPGKEAYFVTVEHYPPVMELARFRAGEMIAVAVDPEKPGEVSIP